MQLLYLHEFVIEFNALDKRVRKQLLSKLNEFSRQDLPSYPHQALQGKQFKGLYKLRVADWRLIYQIHHDGIRFVTLGHRSDVYR